MNDSLGCNEIFIAIADPDGRQLTDFYTQLFGRSPDSFIPQVYAEYRLPGLRLGLFKPKSDHWPEFAHSAHSGISLCLEVTNLEQAIAHLTQLGYPPTGSITVASHGREIYAYDPLGNRLILHESS
jgi:predicted enzyme related to lactoylglutathione lyase